MNKPKALYIHIPFCQKICDYCDFTKLQYFRNFAEKYLVSLEKELDSYHIDYELETIYIGGGTPTSLDNDLFLKLLTIVDKYCHHIHEYTVEVNPESLSLSKLEMMKAHGVNRLSIGVESTDDKILKAIGRNHSFKDVQTAVLNAKKVGFKNINVDLIIGLPQVTKSLLIKDLDNLLTLDVNHISCYSLTVHPNTKFYINHIEEPDGDKARDYYDIVEDKLSKNGYIHYEVSNWAKPGYESKHNFVYWKDEQYYGVGLGASGYIGNKRYTNTKNIGKYNDGYFVSEKELVTEEDDKTYFIMLNLRTNRGLIYFEYQERFNEDFRLKHLTTIERLEKEGFILTNNDKIVATYQGMMILDQIIIDLLNE